MNKKEYESYLVSEHWKSFRTSFYKVNKRECKQCKSTVNLNLHHLTYERLGKERLSDVICLCEVCHHELHKQLDKNKHKKTKRSKRSRQKKSYGKISCKNCKFFVFGYYCDKYNKSAPYGYRTFCKAYKPIGSKSAQKRKRKYVKK